VWNFRTDVDLLLAGKGLLQATDEVDLEEKLAFLLSSPAESQALVRRAQQLITDNHGAVDVTLENVLALMKERGV
jgi:3-deoxy-D-manno-octulosonic-acid transferase